MSVTEDAILQRQSPPPRRSRFFTGTSRSSLGRRDFLRRHRGRPRSGAILLRKIASELRATLWRPCTSPRPPGRRFNALHSASPGRATPWRTAAPEALAHPGDSDFSALAHRVARSGDPLARPCASSPARVRLWRCCNACASPGPTSQNFCRRPTKTTEGLVSVSRKLERELGTPPEAQRADTEMPEVGGASPRAAGTLISEENLAGLKGPNNSCILRYFDHVAALQAANQRRGLYRVPVTRRLVPSTLGCHVLPFGPQGFSFRQLAKAGRPPGAAAPG